MYDMYSWEQPASPADDHAETGQAAESAQAASAVQVAQAVQVALDRRDNGGAAAA